MNDVDDDDPAQTPDAIALLTADHDDVRELFADYDELVVGDAPSRDRVALVTEICNALTAHATAEEELFYPAVRTALGEEELVDEAEREHASARALVDRLKGMTPDDDGYEDTVRVLAESIEHHAQEEEEEMFPRVRDSDLDLVSLGEKIAARKEEVLADLEGIDAE